MRLSGSGIRGVRSVRGTLSGRFLLRVIVGYEGDYLVGNEAGAAVQVGELYEEGDACDGGTGVLDEVAHSAGGAARCEEVVGDEDAGAGGDGVRVGLEGVGAVLQLVCGGDRLARELVRLSSEDEALAGTVGQSRAEDEAAGLGREDTVVVEAVGGKGQGVYGGVEGLAILYKGGNVLERDAGFREIGDGADVALEVTNDLLHPVHVGAQGAKVSITLAIISSFMRESTAARWRALFIASATRWSSPLRSSGFRICLNIAASRSTAAMMPRRCLGWIAYFAISRAMRAISASLCVSSPLRPITPTATRSSTKRVSVSRVSASSSRVYVLSSRTR